MDTKTEETAVEDATSVDPLREGPLDAAKISKALGVPKTLIVSKRGEQGTGNFGLYTEIVAFSSATDAFTLELRLLVFGKTVCKYTRKRRRKSGRWMTSTYADHATACRAALLAVERLEKLGYATMFRGDALLVELSEKDIAAIAANEHLPSRFTASVAFNKLFGELPADDADWKRGETKPTVVDYTASKAGADGREEGIKWRAGEAAKKMASLGSGY